MLQNIFSTVLQLHLLQFTCTGEKHIFGPQRILWWWLGRYKSWFQSLALFLWACLHQVNGCSTIALGKQLGKESLFLCWLMRADLLSLCCNSTFVFSREKVWILFPPLDKPLCVRVCVRAQFFSHMDMLWHATDEWVVWILIYCQCHFRIFETISVLFNGSINTLAFSPSLLSDSKLARICIFKNQSKREGKKIIIFNVSYSHSAVPC